MRIWLLCLLFCVNMDMSSAQQGSLLDHMSGTSLWEMHLTLDWRQFLKTKVDKVYVPSSIYCVSHEGDTIFLEGKVKARGHMRLAICNIPPIKLKIAKESLSKAGFNAFNEMDIAHPCHQAASYEQYILKEYLAYKLWELISPWHLRTQLIYLYYHSIDGRESFAQSPAFIVENEEELLARCQAKKVNNSMISQDAIDSTMFLQLCLFQFMIGNTDWYVSNRHNLEFMGVQDKPLLHCIPFDFDYSGLVGARYASHHESIQLSSVASRYYQGKCRSEEDVMKALAIFFEKKDAILALPATIPGLDERSVRHAVEYLESFYDIIEHPKKRESQIIRHCGMWPAQ